MKSKEEIENKIKELKSRLKDRAYIYTVDSEIIIVVNHLPEGGLKSIIDEISGDKLV